jgi:hypothetical protein
MENITIECLCGCGNEILKFDTRGRERKYLPGHNKSTKGIVWSAEHNRKISESLRNNPEVVDRLRKQCRNKLGKKFPNIKRNAEWLVEYNLEHSGENHWNWHGGIGEYTESRRKLKEYRIWRGEVLKRDGYRCQRCGESVCELHVHHIKLFSQFKELATDVSNGITLCKKCHYKEHYK